MDNYKHQKKNMSACRPPHCLVIPFPTHSFIDPMIQFSKRLQAKGVNVTLILTHSFFKTLHKPSTLPFPIKTISDGHDTGGLHEASSLQDYLTKFQQIGSLALSQLLEKNNNKKLVFTVDCIIYAAILPWALDVAKKFGLVGAAFFSHSCTVNNLYYHAHKEGLQKIPPMDRWKIDMKGLPLLKPADMFSLMYVFGFHHGLFDILVNQFSNVGEADWLFCNTFLELERPVVETMEKKLSWFRTIGPHIPSTYLDKRLKYDKEYGVYFSKPGSRACIKWLKKQPEASVVYISMGSVNFLEREQVGEVAWGIKGSNRSFLWEIDESEQAMLPKTFVKEMCEQEGVGMVVSWCPQVEVLAQKSIGCFVTDCQWNSVLEAKSLGVPIVAIPQRKDQRCNETYVTGVWKTGISSGPWGVGKEVERCIREVMDGERAGEMRRNAMEWRELARNAVDKGGSSDTNIDEFVASLIHSGHSTKKCSNQKS